MFTTIIIPDIHGDFEELCHILQSHSILKSYDADYIHKMMSEDKYSEMNMLNKKIVQLGDILDSKSRNMGSDDLLKYSDMLPFIFLCNMKKTFPDQVILILGNHEFLNYNSIFYYVSSYSKRNEQIIDVIRTHIDDYFDYYHIDDNNFLYIHSSIPEDTTSVNTLENYSKMLKYRKYSNIEVEELYSKVFTRKIPSLNLLNILNVEKVFFGHTPHIKQLIYFDKIYYLDMFISKSFNMNNDYEITNVKNKKVYVKQIKRTVA